jgi:hypothetical protein
MNKIKIFFLVLILAVSFLIALRLYQQQKHYLIIEVEKSSERDFLVFFDDKLKSKMMIQKYKYAHFYILKPRFSIFVCYESKFIMSYEMITTWAEASNFENPLFDVGPIIFHDVNTTSSFKSKIVS